MIRILDVYTRVSQLEDDDRMRSIEGQEQDCRGRVAELGARVGKVYCDPGLSAWNPRVIRPAWQALMARLEAGDTDGVVVFDLARFSRKPKDGEKLIEVAENGAQVYDSEAHFDLTSPDGKMAFRNQINAAAYESDRLSKRVRRGMKLKASKGEVARRRSFGYESDGVTIRDAEAEVIREAARRLLAGEPQATIMSDISVSPVKASTWNYTTFRRIMTRPRNAGYIVYKGQPVDGVRLPGEPILDETTYRRVVAMYAARRPGRQPSGRYLLTGIAICGRPECGRALNGRPVSPATRKSDPDRRQYWCRGCRKTFADVRPLDDWTLHWACSTLSDPAHADAIERAEQELEERRAKLEAESASIEQTLIEIAGRLGRGEISLARHDAATVPLDARLAEILTRVRDLAAAEPVPERLPSGARLIPARDRRYLHWLEVATEGSPGEQRAMVLRALAGRKLVIGRGTSARFDQKRVSVV